MALELFKIGSNDYTNNIVNGTFEVQKNDVYDEWTDGNRKNHREIVRTRIAGEFTMMFRTLASYQAFVSDLVSNKTTGGYVPCTIKCNNTLDSNTANLYITMSPVATQKSNLVMDYGEIDVEIEEA